MAYVAPSALTLRRRVRSSSAAESRQKKCEMQLFGAPNLLEMVHETSHLLMCSNESSPFPHKGQRGRLWSFVFSMVLILLVVGHPFIKVRK